MLIFIMYFYIYIFMLLLLIIIVMQMFIYTLVYPGNILTRLLILKFVHL